MSSTTPDLRVQHTADLLRSLQSSILRLRHEAEDLRERLARAAAEPDADAGAKHQIAKLEGLIRDCQKVEKALVEQTDLKTGGGAGLNLGAARAEIRGRLDRLRAARGAGGDAGEAD